MPETSRDACRHLVSKPSELAGVPLFLGRPRPLSQIHRAAFFERAICRKHNVWLHVDSAMAGAAAVCPEFRWMLAGLEHVDSYCFNPHKWLLVNFDCDCLYVADKAALTSAMKKVQKTKKELKELKTLAALVLVM